MARKKVRFARLPNRKGYHDLINEVFDSGWVTSMGTCARKLEDRLRSRFGTDYVVLTIGWCVRGSRTPRTRLAV